MHNNANFLFIALILAQSFFTKRQDPYQVTRLLSAVDNFAISNRAQSPPCYEVDALRVELNRTVNQQGLHPTGMFAARCNRDRERARGSDARQILERQVRIGSAFVVPIWTARIG